jgi:hypothetical protein
MAWTNPITYVSGAILTAAQLNTNVRDNTQALFDSVRRIDLKTRATNYTINQSALSSAGDVFSTDITFTADGTSSYVVEMHFPAVDNGATGNQMLFHFTDGGNNSLFGAVASVFSGSGQVRASVFVRKYWTPTAGSQSLNVRAIFTGGAGTAFMDPVSFSDAHLALFGPVLT